MNVWAKFHNANLRKARSHCNNLSDCRRRSVTFNTCGTDIRHGRMTKCETDLRNETGLLLSVNSPTCRRHTQCNPGPGNEAIVFWFPQKKSCVVLKNGLLLILFFIYSSFSSQSCRTSNNKRIRDNSVCYVLFFVTSFYNWVPIFKLFTCSLFSAVLWKCSNRLLSMKRYGLAVG
jgi:hypothetical protein